MHGEQSGYTHTVDDNLFTPLGQVAQAEINAGDGGELIGNPARMQALHSSSSIAVNVFNYWHGGDDFSVIGSACRLIGANATLEGSIAFEQTFEIDARFQRAPNLDVVIRPTEKSKRTFAIECKFTEPYNTRGLARLSPRYLEIEALWNGLTATRQLAETVCPNGGHFQYLDSPQLIKHILGLKTQCGRKGYRLLYLWYDAFGHSGAKHREEVEEFSATVRADGVDFLHLTYQELIRRLTPHREMHTAYVDYLCDRYL